MRRLVLIRLAVLLAALGAATGGFGAAQSKKAGGFTGIVLGTDGKPVEHASVMCQSAGGNAAHAVYTDAKGHFAFAISSSRSDEYNLHASANGFSSTWKKNVPLGPGQSKSITLRLIKNEDQQETGTPSDKKK